MRHQSLRRLARYSVVVLSSAFIGGCGGSSRSSPPPPETAAGAPAQQDNHVLVDRIEEMVAESQSIGAITRLDLDAHQARVNPEAWATWDADEKKTFATTLAMYCERHSSVPGRYIDVIDNNSGKKLSHYDPSGVVVY